MKEFNNLQRAVAEVNEKFGLELKVSAHKSMYKLEGVPEIRTIFGNFKQIFDMIHRTYRKYDVTEEPLDVTTSEIEEAMQNEADELQAEYEEELANIEYGGPHD